MQTFLPYPDFYKSAKVIDDGKRLNKQCLEAIQILKLNLGITNKGYRYHPARIMYIGYDGFLFNLTLTYCLVWKESENNKKQENKNLKELLNIKRYCDKNNIDLTSKTPWWFGNKKFHLSHKSNLLRKNYNHYSKYFKVKNNLPYYYPVTSHHKCPIYNIECEDQKILEKIKKILAN